MHSVYDGANYFIGRHSIFIYFESILRRNVHFNLMKQEEFI